MKGCNNIIIIWPPVQVPLNSNSSGSRSTMLLSPWKPLSYFAQWVFQQISQGGKLWPGGWNFSERNVVSTTQKYIPKKNMRREKTKMKSEEIDSNDM